MVKYECFARTATHLFASIFLITSLSYAGPFSTQRPAPTIPQSSDTAAIYIQLIPERLPTGQNFWVEVHVGTEEIPVDSLFGISFQLVYSPPQFINTIKPDTSNFFSGTLLGDNVVFFTMDEEDLEKGVISVAVTRKAGSPSVSGYGTVFRARLHASAAGILDSTNVSFSLQRVNGRDRDGNPVPLKSSETATVLYVPEDFSLSFIPTTQTIELGRQAQFELAIASIGGFDKKVPLAIEPTYAGIRAAFSADSIKPGQPVILTLSTDSTITPGSYPFEVVAAIDTLRHTAQCTLHVYSVPITATSEQSEYLTNSPFQIAVQVGADNRPATRLQRVSFRLRYNQTQFVTAVFSDSLQPAAGDFLGANANVIAEHAQADGVIRFSLESALQAGASGAGSIVNIPFTSALETPDRAVVAFTIDSVTAFDVDDQPIYLAAQAYSVTLSEKVSYTLQITPETQTVSAGETANYQVSLTGSQSYEGTATLSVLGEPLPSLHEFSPAGIGQGQISDFTLQTDTTTANGTYTLTIRGVDGDISAETTATLIVTPAPSFSIVVIPPDEPVYPGDSTRYRIRIDQTDNLDGPVSLTLSNHSDLPWLTSALSSTTIDPFSEAILSFFTDDNAPFGTFEFLLFGQNGTTTRAANIQLMLVEPPPPVRPIPFTPNNDGFNDKVVFEFEELQVQPGEIFIFDLHGRKIIELRGKTEWDGKDENGNVAKPGAYLYVVRVDGEVLKKGMLALAR